MKVGNNWYVSGYSVLTYRMDYNIYGRKNDQNKTIPDCLVDIIDILYMAMWIGKFVHLGVGIHKIPTLLNSGMFCANYDLTTFIINR